MTKSFRPIFTITNRITAMLTRIERARGFLEAATLSETWLREMGRRALILEAHHITHIEGTRLTLEQAERLCPEVNRRSLQRDLKVMGTWCRIVLDRELSRETLLSPDETSPLSQPLMPNAGIGNTMGRFCGAGHSPEPVTRD